MTFDFTVLVLDQAYPASVSITLASLHAAAALAPRCSVAAPHWRVCSLTGGIVQLQQGMSLATEPLPDHVEDRSCWIVPALGLETIAKLRQRLGDPDLNSAGRRISQHVCGGGRVAASCSAVFVLMQAGLLAERTATTSWWLAPLLAELEPRCRVQSDRMICHDGLLTTAGAALGQADLMLYLIGALNGNALKEIVGRMLLIEQRPAQAPFIVPAMLANGTQLISQLTAKIEAQLPQIPKVRELAQSLCMTERTLARHVLRATGRSPMALIQSVRLQRVRALLEHSRMPIEQIAAAVGYADPTALRRLMKKLTGSTPSAHR